MNHRFGLKTTILLPLALVLAVLMGILHYGLYRHEKTGADEDFVLDMQSAQTYFQRALLRRSEKLGAALEVILRDELFQAALRAKDRDALLKRAAPLFKDFHDQYGITHFYFEDAKRVNVLRVHQPERHGDTIDHFTTLTAERTGASASGVELGPLGTFTLRAVAPMYDSKGLIGYVELGEEIEEVLHGVQAIVGTDHLLAIDKQFLKRKAWEDGMLLLGRPADWERLPDAVIAHQTLDLPSESVTRILSQEEKSSQDMDLEIGAKHYYAGTIPVKDASGRKVGKLLVLRDKTQSLAEMKAILRSLSLYYLALGGALLTMFYLITTRVQRRLEKARQDIVAHGLEREAIQAQHIIELQQESDKLLQARNELLKKEASLSRAQQIARVGNWDWDIADKRLNWSDEIYRIFGLQPQEFGATYEAFLEHVHPEDRDKVIQGVNAALAGERPYEIEHRILRPDGTELTVLERAEVTRDAAGQAIQMTGTMQDITERKQAEKDINLADQVFENSIEGIIITDAQANILRVNRAFTTITGYSEEEVLGRNPRLLQSDRHDVAFFQAMWALLVEYGYWQGEVWNRRKSGEVYPQWLSMVAIRNEQGETIHYLGVFADLSEKKQAEAHLHHLAYYDALTELPNRLLLEERMKQVLAAASNNNSLVAVLHLDLDRFKTINDTLGHPFGDKLLQAVAERLAGRIRSSDTIARFSGDEFAVVLADVGSQDNAKLVAGNILEAMSKPFNLEENEVFITSSIGVAFYPVDADNMDDLIRNADTAMSHAKAQGGNGYRLYGAEMNALLSQRLALENGLRHALERGEFVLHYQPQISLLNSRIIGMEALLRWQHPERGLVSPGEFIPVLEETGLIVPVGEWVLRTACAQNSAWLAAGLPPMRVAVNLSAHQFRQSNLVDVVCLALEDSGLEPELLEMEVTESIMIQDVHTTITTLNQLHVIGIQISIDDFGTGYSSLSYLKRLPISKIKIDQSFVRDICTDPDDAAIADAVISLGHSLKMQVIAEGVETLEQLDYLRAHGCDEMQGYYFSRPLPAEAFAELVRRQ
ncbi:MAG: EAL domain-containing protein [Sulfuricellaceae bacterium]|nr:EAL domain-containing protein [Sulfuricellaceae bacterium]